MKFLLVDRRHVVATCDAATKLGAITKMKPKGDEYVVSEASHAIGFSRMVTKALNDSYPLCTTCHGPIRPGTGIGKKHYRCHELVQRAKLRKVRRTDLQDRLERMGYDD